MKKILILSWLVLSFYTLTSQNDINRISQAEKIYGLSKLWQEVNYNFAYMDRLDLNWDEEYKKHIDKVINSQNDKEYYEILENFINLLKERHTLLYQKPDYLTEKNSGQAHNAWFYVNWVGEDLCVIATRSILNDSLPHGSIITEINSVPTKEFFEKEYENKVNSIFEQTKKKIYAQLFNFTGTQDKVEKIKIKCPENQEIEIIFPKTLNPSDYNWSPSRSLYFGGAHFNPSSKLLEDNILYINFAGHMDQKLVEYFDSIVPEINKSNGIILDLRHTWGGSNIGSEIVSYFTNEPYIYNFVDSRVNIGTRRAHGAYTDTSFVNIIGEPRNFHYENYYRNNSFIQDTFKTKNSIPNEKKIDKPLIILINSNIESAAEGFLITFKQYNIGQTVGKPTGGSCSQPLLVSLPMGGIAWIATQRTMIGQEIFFFIEPDILVQNTIEKEINGIDVIFEEGLRIMKEKIDRK